MMLAWMLLEEKENEFHVHNIHNLRLCITYKEVTLPINRIYTIYCGLLYRRFFCNNYDNHTNWQWQRNAIYYLSLKSDTEAHWHSLQSHETYRVCLCVCVLLELKQLMECLIIIQSIFHSHMKSIFIKSMHITTFQ